MTLKLENLINSDFWIKHSNYYDIDSKSSKHVLNRTWIAFDTNLVTDDNLNHLDIVYNKLWTSTFYQSELYGSIRTSILPLDWKKEILTQWRDILSIIKTLEKTPVWSALTICTPGSEVGKHIHHFDIKQSLTFCFSYFNDSEKQSYFHLYDNDNNKIKTISVSQDRSVFTWKDNLPHSAHANSLCFFWLYDFSEHIDLDETKFTKFAKLNTL